MDETLEDEELPVPPTPSRVAARALVLASVSCRALIEKDAGEDGAEELRLQIVPWLEGLGVLDELETAELDLISVPLGALERKARLNASWKSEGMVVLAWALGFAELPPIQEQCEPSDVANGMGFLGERDETPLSSPRLVPEAEIQRWADSYLTLHWRLREFKRTATRMHFPDYTKKCGWGPLSVSDLEIVVDDLAVDGVRIDELDSGVLQNLISITQERHQAFNWLLGLEAVYSEVATDT